MGLVFHCFISCFVVAFQFFVLLGYLSYVSVFCVCVGGVALLLLFVVSLGCACGCFNASTLESKNLLARLGFLLELQEHAACCF